MPKQLSFSGSFGSFLITVPDIPPLLLRMHRMVIGGYRNNLLKLNLIVIEDLVKLSTPLGIFVRASLSQHASEHWAWSVFRGHSSRGRFTHDSVGLNAGV